ncbi:hypothetical protein BGZ99_000987 [Dissophora globulifera]|uniref:Retrotransposon gag domain-containing protein n=1 Tax=Dissophora globulifera TaxID=979702 RepID=A0A9P6QZG8_9FUNG|nr:hypothetical protein BGZ99_000987 [Dissophora globulifera]
MSTNHTVNTSTLSDEQKRDALVFLRDKKKLPSVSEVEYDLWLDARKPGPYKGAIDALACRDFLDYIEEYCSCVSLEKTLWVEYAVLSITGDAKSWWRDSTMTLATPWSEFRKEFINAFTPPNSARDALEALFKLKQTKDMSIAEYTSRFRRLMRLTENLDPGTALYVYQQGLESETSKQVQLRQPCDLENAIREATVVHGILRKYNKRASLV